MFIAALFIVSPTWKQTQMPILQVNEQTNCATFIHVTLLSNKTEQTTHTPASMDLEDMLSKKKADTKMFILHMKL
jgi:hypothetical protein